MDGKSTAARWAEVELKGLRDQAKELDLTIGRLRLLSQQGMFVDQEMMERMVRAAVSVKVAAGSLRENIAESCR